jgi:hypothetical protein
MCPVKLVKRLSLSFVTLLSLLAADVYAQPRDNLFTIARSKNANIVRYDVHRTPEGKLDGARPVDAYWLMLAENGHREELTFMERELAYGFSVSKISASGFSLQLSAFKQREIRIEYAGGSFHARAVIMGRRATLSQIFVRSEEGGLLPRVQYVELRGIADGGVAVVERILAP